MAFSASINLPLARDIPAGYSASMTISIPFGLDLDALGWTDELNPWGLWPFLSLITRKKRSSWEPMPGVNYAGGDRELLYQILEDYLYNLGFEGHGCLLRAICEMFEMPLHNHGFVGELLEIFLSPSRSPWSNLRLKPYLEAERHGRVTGECWRYYKGCKQSFFTMNNEKKWRQKQNKKTEKAPVQDEKVSAGEEEPCPDEIIEKSEVETEKERRTKGSVKKDLAARNSTAYTPYVAEDPLE
ncbi:uncharacterized protein LOC143035689 [Oratosquilla oratoria]|uniref:uncharacterized protein LOC143035689 n=1 Tax=Oratosquilla oratoria TaxID=337810 RepID=UPI003F776A40